MKTTTGTGSASWTRYAFFSIFCSLLGISFSVNAETGRYGFHFQEGKTETVIPFELVNKLIVIPVKINKDITVKTFLDTGFRSFVLYGKRNGKTLDFKDGRKVRFSGLGNGSCSEGYLSIENTLKIGDVIGQGVGIVHIKNKMPIPQLAYHGVEAAFGYQLFSRFVVSIDYEAMLITLKEKLSSPDIQCAVGMPLRFIDTKPCVESTLSLSNGTTVIANLALDTGSSRPLLLYADTKKGLNLPVRKNNRHIGRGLNGNIKGYIGTLPKLRIGSLEVKDVNVAIINNYSCDKVFSEKPINGLIGSGVLSSFKVTFDYPGQMVYFQSMEKHQKWPFADRLSAQVH